MDENKHQRNPIVYYGIIIVTVILLNAFVFPNFFDRSSEEVDYGTFLKMIDQAIVTEVEIEEENITFKTMEDEEEKIYKTGNATFGRDFDYQLDQLRYYEEKDSYVVFDLLYLTASGYITTEGMGTYQDMDQINTGHVSNVTIPEILVDYGTPIFKTKKLTRDDIKR